MTATAVRSKPKKSRPAHHAGPPTEAAGQPPPRRAPTYQLQGAVTTVPIARLMRHPQNRLPTASQVETLAASIELQGQLEPIVVRPLAVGSEGGLGLDGTRLRPGDGAATFQIVSGETRSLACLELGRTHVTARVLEACDDAQVLVLLAEYNAARSDLNPIQKAQLIHQLCLPAAAGGGGLTRQEAARIYGLESHSAASNLVRLLELPEAAQRFVASGQLPQSFARDALAHFAVPALAEALGEEIGRWQEDGPPSRDQWHEVLDDAVRQKTRSMDKADKQQRHAAAQGWSFGNNARLFAAESDLGVAPLSLHGRPVLRATNVERWDALQADAVAALKAKARQRTDRQIESPGKARTAGEQRALEKEQDEQLAKRIRRWRHAWLRDLIACRLRGNGPDHWTAAKLAMWCIGHKWGYSDQVNLDERLDEASGVKDRLVLTQQTATWQNLLEAMCNALVVPERNPDFPAWPFALVDQLAADVEIDVADSWLVMQSSSQGNKEPLETFLALHNQRQLRAIAKELGVSVPETATKAGAVRLFLGLPRVFRLPSSIEPVGPRKRKAK